MADKNISVRLGARVDAYVAAMRAAGTATTGFSRATQRNLRTVGTQMQNLGRSATMFISVPIAAAGAFAVKAAVDWESAWAGVTKTVDGTAEQLAELESGLRDMSKELPATHAEIAAVAEAAGALGVATEDIEFFTRTMIDLGETTNLTADEAATSIAQMMNVMQTAPDDVDNLASALVHLGNNGASTEAQILDMATRIAAAGELVGLSESDVLGFANALASMGIEAEAGGSAFSRVITDISKAVSQGGTDLETFASVAGVSADQFATSFREDPTQAIVSFIDGLSRIHQAGGDVFTVLDELGLSDVRVSRALLSMATSGDLLSTSLEQGEQAWIDNTALADEAAKRYDTAGARFEMVRNQIVDLFIDLGNIMLPAVEAVVGFVGDMAEAFQSLPQPVQIAVGGLLALVAAAGPMVMIAGSLVKNIAAISAAMSLMGPAATKASLALGAIGIAAIAGFAAYRIFTAEQRKTDEVTEAVSAQLLVQMGALFAAGDAAGFAATEIDAVATANEALSLALGEGYEDLASAFSALNVDAGDMFAMMSQFANEPVTALDNLARSFGFTAEQADTLAHVNFDSFGNWRRQAEHLSEAVGISEADFIAFGEAVQDVQFSMDNVDVQAIARQFLDAQVAAHGYEDSLVQAAEAQSDQRRQTGDALSVLYAWTQIVADADQTTQDAVFSNEAYGEAIAALPPELQALMDGATGAADAVGDLEGVQASSIDTMSRQAQYLADVEHVLGEYSAGLDAALGNTRDWVRAHDGFASGLLNFADSIEDASAGVDYNTEAAAENREGNLENRAAVLDLADELIRLTESNIASGMSQEDVTAEYLLGRDALLDAAEAAGLSREETDALITSYGLVPELVTTGFKIANLALTQWQIERYLEKLETIPEDVAVQIEAAIERDDIAEAIRLLNSIPDPHVRVRISLPNLPRISYYNGQPTYDYTNGTGNRMMATGGFVRGGSNVLTTIAEIGGSRGDEVVLPLGDPARMAALLGMSEVGPRVAAALGGLMPSSSGGGGSVGVGGSTVYNVNVNMPPGADGDDVVRALKQWQRRSGPLPLAVR